MAQLDGVILVVKNFENTFSRELSNVCARQASSEKILSAQIDELNKKLAQHEASAAARALRDEQRARDIAELRAEVRGLQSEIKDLSSKKRTFSAMNDLPVDMIVIFCFLRILPCITLTKETTPR